MRMPKGLGVLCGSMAAVGVIASCADSHGPTAVIDSEHVSTTSQALLSSAWTSAVSMGAARQNHVAALLNNGSVLVAGGHPGNNVPVSSTEVFSPATGVWTTVGSMGTARRLFGACTLPSGKVLVAGGNAGAGDVASAELFDPSTSTWSGTGSLASAREDFSTTCLPDGRVLVAGGSGPSGLLSSAEVYNPTAGTWSSAGTLPAAVHTQGAALLSDGRVLIAGGNNASGPVSTAALWSPSTNAWAATGSMSTARAFYALNLLSDGRVLAAGGLVNVLLADTNTAEIYSPSAGTWSAAAHLNTARYSGVSATLSAGPIVVGGVNGGSPLATSESYDSVHNTWTQVATAYGAVNQTATALSSSSALVAGGNIGGSPSQATKSAQTYGLLNVFAVYAQRSVTLGSSDHINGGDVGVAGAAASTFGTQLVVGGSATVQTNHNLVAPSVSLASGAHVGDVQTNSLTNSGATLGTLASYPSSMPPSPLSLPTGPGGSNVTVPALTITTLNPGNYGAVSVTGTLYLNAGAYTFASVTMADQAHLAGVSGTATVSVAGAFQAGNSVSISSPGSTPAGQLVISVAASDSGTTPAFSVGTSAAMSAVLSAPHGTLSIGASSIATGAFAGFDVKLGTGVTINYQSGFVGSQSHGSQTLAAALPSLQATSPLVGPVPGNTVLHLAFEVPIQNQTALVAQAQQLYAPTSSQYHKFLTVDQFAASYGLTSTQYQQITSYVQSLGLTVTTTYANKLFFEASGTVAALEGAFNVNMNYYQRPEGGQFFAPDRIPTLSPPLPLGPVVGLNNVNLPQNAPVAVSPPPLVNNLGSGPNGSFIGNDLRNFYMPDTSLTGEGQSIALVEFADFYDTDITAYRNASTPPIPLVHAPQRIPVMGGPGQVITIDNAEVALDIEMALAIAPSATVRVYEAPDLSSSLPGASDQTIFDAEAAAVLTAIANDKDASNHPTSLQISSSITGMDGSAINNALTQFMMQGQSFFISSGDLGAYAVGDPEASAPLPFNDPAVNLMTVVGGTQAVTGQGTSTGCLVETTWNAPSEYPKGAGGGGICSPNPTVLPANPPFVASIPVSAGVPSPSSGLNAFWSSTFASSANGASNQFRNLPDVSALADNVYTVANQGQGSGDRGTSASAPMWAGFAALANQMGPTTGLGFLNPALYAIGQDHYTGTGAKYAADFRDIADSSNNSETGSSSAPFKAVAGYDLATGWGSPRLGLLTDLSGVTSVLPFNTYDQIQITIGTDGDDLRCTSIVVVTLQDASGNDLMDITVHSQGASTWDQGSSHNVGPLAISTTSPVARDTIASIKITMYQTGDTCQGGTQRDFWDIGSVLAVLSSTTSSATATILNLAGAPDLSQLGATDPSSVTFQTLFTCH